MALLARVQHELETLQWGLITLQCKMHDLCSATVFGLASAEVKAEAGEPVKVQLVAVRAARMIAESKKHPSYLFNPQCVFLQMTAEKWLGAEEILKSLSSVPCTVKGLTGMLAALSSFGLGVAVVRPGLPMAGYYDEPPGLRAALYGGALPTVPLPEVFSLPLLACCDPSPLVSRPLVPHFHSVFCTSLSQQPTAAMPLTSTPVPEAAINLPPPMLGPTSAETSDRPPPVR